MKAVHFALLVTTFFLFSFSSVQAQTKDPIERVWYDQPKTGKIEIYKQGNKFYGKIVWLKEPLDVAGKPKTDIHNPEEKLRSVPVLNLVNLKGFTKAEDGKYVGGTVYDPKIGKTYSCKMTIVGSTLEVRGYIGVPLFGRTEVWTFGD